MKEFGSFRAVDNINLDIAKGEIFGFLGANGAGKTTTIRMLCGLLLPSSGSITVDGLDIAKHSEGVKHKIGYMSQKFFSVSGSEGDRESGILCRNISSAISKKALANIRDVMDQFGLTDILSSSTGALPMGYKQRLSLVAALVHDPPLVFFG
ncbi:MAG: ABC transporter ATP-binding protein [Candidatus Cloacimonetes bacterium]|nr:ABC transporter ATP-binding protein [Candidatus Cloacimonadota bacterium]